MIEGFEDTAQIRQDSDGRAAIDIGRLKKRWVSRPVRCGSLAKRRIDLQKLLQKDDLEMLQQRLLDLD